jgi:Uma2 family endonuclease
VLNRPEESMAAYRMPPPEQSLTIEEFERIPEDGYREDGYRSELVRGRLVREPPPGAEHGGVSATLTIRLGHYVRQHRLGRLLTDSGFILTENPPTIRAPDIAFIAAARIRAEGLPTRYFPGAPANRCHLLAVRRNS